MTTTAYMLICRPDLEAEVEITGYVIPVIRGHYSGPPEQCFPDEGGGVEDITAELEGQPFELTADETAKAENILREASEE